MNGYTNAEKIKAIDAVDVTAEIASDLYGLAQILDTLANGDNQILPATCSILADNAYTMGAALEKVSELMQPAG